MLSFIIARCFLNFSRFGELENNSAILHNLPHAKHILFLYALEVHVYIFSLSYASVTLFLSLLLTYTETYVRLF